MVFVALVSTTAAVWLWNWTGHWQLFELSGHSSSDGVTNPIPQSLTKPPGSFENNTDLDVVTPSNDTNVAAHLQLQHSEAVERLFPASAIDSWMVHNREALRGLLLCLESDGCRPNQRKSKS